MADMAQTIRDLQDTATVMAGIQARQAEALKEHALWLQEHDRAIAESRERGRQTDERIDRLTVAIGELIRTMKEGK